MAASLYTAYIGIDISKATLDLCLLDADGVLTHVKIENSVAALTKLFKEEAPFNGIKFKRTLICFESIGAYQNHLTTYLLKKKAHFSIQSALHIKRSLGLVRGKSDKIDAERIAEFTQKNQKKLKLWEPPREIIVVLKELLTVRRRLLSIKNMLRVPAKESSTFTTASYQKLITANFECTLSAVTDDLEKLEANILDRIKSDENLARQYEIITSIKYIGFVIASSIITVTNEFKNFDSAGKFASYVGIAPFSYSSGTSLSTKPRVSRIANKEIKALLHLVSISSLRKDGPLKRYYERKKAEGKHPMIILNNMKNKVVRHIFACIREDRLSIAEYQLAPRKDNPKVNTVPVKTTITVL